MADPPQSVRTPVFHPRLFALFAIYVRKYLARHFHAVRHSNSGPPPVLENEPAIFYTNHPSWWDPLFLMLIASKRYADREHYGPMDAEALGKYAFFRKLGIFPVDQHGPRGAFDFLRATHYAMQRPLGTLWLTAEGVFTDARVRPIRLRPGLAHLLRRRACRSVIPVAIEYPFWNERLPEALIRFGPPVPASALEGSSDRINVALSQCLQEVMDGLADEAIGRDPQAFTSLVRGRAGVGLTFDAWRRLKARWRGEIFRSEHDPDRS